jgi:indolepyruvate ferredoxin oxidoreductase
MDTAYELDDRYRLDRDRAYLSGVQALVRLPLVQHERDRAAGLHTGGFISGYRGSPLGTVDLALWQAADRLKAADIHFEPGLNEDLAATAVWGSQQAGLLAGATHDGVFGLWYGKGPGVDRSCDALKHGNFAGSAPLGGVLAVAGDDHGAKSSSLAHQSEHAFIHCGIPVLYPSDVQDVLDLGLHGWALSRYAGCWTGMKAVTDVVETSQSVDVTLDRVRVLVPDDALPDRHIAYAMPPLPVENRALTTRLRAAQRYVEVNHLDRVRFGSPRPRVGIVTAGKAYGDVLQALQALGVDDEEADRLRLAVYKVAMTWPLEPVQLRAFAAPLESLLIVEEKRPVLEDQIARILYDLDRRPVLAGKHDEAGHSLLPEVGELDPTLAAEAIGRWLDRPIPARRTIIPLTGPTGPTRAAAFCAGCPHNTSTVVPEGSFAHGGIGCHGMAAFMPDRRTLGYTHMGGEGANWIGHRPFTTTRHIFQNLGDGTYTHSGSLAIRASVAAGVDITYKILVNGAVAMTGGQPLEGHAALDGPEIVRSMCAQLLSEGVREVAVVTDAPATHRDLRGGVRVHHRDELDSVQRRLRDVPGVTALVYDQVCAAEARRLRKRGRLADPARRIVINEEVCEGCGDCSVQSNCIAIEPVETALGRKRQINQDACNKDDSCLRGYCPSFAVVTNATRRRPEAATVDIDDLLEDLPPAPVAPTERPWNLLITGIGGTGVVTVGALVGVAAHLEGLACAVLDVTGLAQKNGPVASHIRVAADARSLGGSRIPRGGADAIVGCDIVVTAAPDMLGKAAPGRTRAIVNRDVAPTAEFATNPDLDLSSAAMEHAITAATGDGAADYVAASALTRGLLGDTVTMNVFLLGMAAQRGLLPVSVEALERAIDLNGTKVELNRRSFRLGRAAGHDLASVERRAEGTDDRGDEPDDPATLDEVVAHRAALVRAWGGKTVERRYRAVVDRAGAAEAAITGTGSPGDLSLAVARTYAKLLAYKDEYEVARLWSDRTFRRALDKEFEPGYRVHLNLAPQRFFPVDATTGRAKKVTFGPWMMHGMRLLARGRVIRGTPLDVFGRTSHRRRERALVKDYEALVDEVLATLDGPRLSQAVELLALPEQIRGYGLVKDASIAEVAAAQSDLLARWRESELASRTPAS